MTLSLSKKFVTSSLLTVFFEYYHHDYHRRCRRLSLLMIWNLQLCLKQLIDFFSDKIMKSLFSLLTLKRENYAQD